MSPKTLNGSKRNKVMKKLLILSTSLISTAVMAAAPVNQPIGSSFTLGSSLNQRALTTASANPAAPFLMVNDQEGDSFRFGIIGPIGVGVEFGDISDLSDQIDRAEAKLDATYSSVTEANDAISEVNGILNDIADTAYVKVSASTQVPLMPIIYKTENSGAFMLDASVSVVGRGSLLASNITSNVSGSSYELTSNTSMYAKVATDLNIGLGYSQKIWQPESESGVLVGGIKANFHQLSLGQALSVLSDDSEDASDVFSDTITDDAESATGVGLDLGLIWYSDIYHAGITIANINEPEFDYNAVGTNCSSKTGSALTSCNAAADFISAGKLSATSTYTMETQTTLDFSVSTPAKQVSLGLSYDVNPVEDAVGDEYQWAVASVSYYGDSHFLPGLRAGFRQNMAGTELSYATAGLTLLKRLNLDVAIALDTVTDEDGDEIPRSGYISLGYDTAF